MLFLSGPMGAGKSSVAHAIGERTGRPVVDLDAAIAARVGKSVVEIFRDVGEARFREIEKSELFEVLRGAAPDVVVALGGGTVRDAESRRALLDRGVLVTLAAPAEVLATRVAHEMERPLLVGRDAVAVLARLLVERADAYAEAHASLDTSERDVPSLADDVLAVEVARPIVVPLGRDTYRVEVGRGLSATIAARVCGAASGVVVIVTDEHVSAAWADPVAAALRERAREVVRVVLPPGEEAKHLGSVERIWDAALGAGADRGALVLAVGGGVVGDLAGFAASTLLRGVSFAQAPTTLLAMVDASVGGKTGFDRREGKNLVGTFHQPRFVVCDLDALSTLPDDERIAGLAEVVKSAWLDSEAAVAALERDADALRAGDPAATERAIRMSIGLKARIVSGDPTEQGARRLLNLGHTVGHAFEAADGYGAMRHGEAVSRGLVAAFRVARSIGRGSEADEARMVGLLARLGLPTDVAGRANEAVLALLASDKKRRGGRVGFVAPAAPGDVEVHPLALDALREIVARVCA